MLFNSLQFALFFPAVTLLYFLTPHRGRWALLLVASSVFYMALIPAYILLVAFIVTVDYLAAWLLEGAVGRRRRAILVVGLGANLGLLGVFKYYDFLNANVETLAHWLDVPYSMPYLSVALPLGLSFHTFQAMSYLVDVYRGHQRALRHFGICALYVLFYPQLVAGPIERSQNLIPQFFERHRFEYARVVDGLALMAWGLFKKVVVADRLAVFVDHVYGDPTAYAGLPLVTATVAFAIQIYCDFSGYSDIALGAAQVMGFRLMTNFRRPYHATSIADFWRRWHISLSTWFRDYLYIPLGGSRVPPVRHAVNVFVTFLLSGLWHGANWTFLVWGALNGLYLLASGWTAPLRAHLVGRVGLSRYPALHTALQVATTFTLTCVAWVFFRANSLADALHVFTHVHAGPLVPRALGGQAVAFPGMERFDVVAALLAVAVLVVVEIVQDRHPVRPLLAAGPVWLRWGLAYALVLAVVVLGEFGSRQFIYFQF